MQDYSPLCGLWQNRFQRYVIIYALYHLFKMYVHLIHDVKFVDRIVDMFDLLRSKHNEYLFITSKTCTANKRAKNLDISAAHNYIMNNAKEIQVVFVHFLDYDKARIVTKLPSSIIVVWFCWGGDAFSLGKFTNSFLLPKSRALQKRIAFKMGFRRGIKLVVKRLLGKYIDWLPRQATIIKVIRRASIMIPVIPQDYLLFKEKYPLNAKCVQLNYTNYLKVEELLAVPENGHHILLGNSADIKNNHIEAIDVLSRIDRGSRKVITPLSYGEPVYAKEITEYGKEKLGDKFTPLLEFMPFDEYRETIKSCGIVIMNHLRQQGNGNIILALWNGAKVFLNRDSLLYSFYKQHGVYIYSIQDDLASNVTTSFKSLGEAEVLKNKEILYRIYSNKARATNLFRLDEILGNLTKVSASC